MGIKMGSRSSGKPGHQLIFSDPKQNDPKDVLKARNDENISDTNDEVSAGDATLALCQLLKQQAELDVKLMLFIETYLTTSISWHCLKKLQKGGLMSQRDD